MKKTIFYFMMLFLCSFGMAQEIAKNAFQLDWGIGTLHRQDLSFSSLIHNPITPINTQITYQRIGKWNHEVSTRFSLFKEWTVDPYFFYHDAELTEESGMINPHQFVFLDLNYSISKQVLSAGNLDFQLGARERNRLQVTDFSGADATHFSYYFCFGMDAKFSATYTINEKSKLYSNLYLPLFSHISRPPYSAQDAEYFDDNKSNKVVPTVLNYIGRGTLESWKNSQIVDFDIAYYYQLSQKWSVGAKYLLSANFNQNPKALNSIENYYYVTTKFQF